MRHFLLGLLMCCAWPLSAWATVTPTLSMQVSVTSAAGGPAADGTYAATLALYDKEAGGTQVWSDGMAALTIKGGLGSAVMGQKVPLDPKVLAAAVWLEVKIEPDPALTRVALRSVALALRSAVAEGLDCSGCVGAAQIDPAVLQPYAKTSDLSVYAKTGSLANVAFSGQYGDLQGAPDLAGLVKSTALADVAFSGKYLDLQGLPALPQLGKSCGTGLVVQGLGADGALQCVAMQAGGGADSLAKLSNGALTNQFNETFSSAASIDIPDNNPVGASDAIVVPDVGTAQSLTVHVDISNSDTSSLVVTLFDPNNTAYVLWNKTAKGNAVKASYPPTPTNTGDLTTWVGKNPKGKWQLSVVDAGFLNNAKDGKINTWSIEVQTLSNTKVQTGSLLATSLQAGTLALTGGAVVGSGVQLGNDDAACTDAKAGTLRWTGSALQLCAQKVWNDLAVITGISRSLR